MSVKKSDAAASYFGGKGGAGTYHTIINLMPPHGTYIETHLGGGAIIRRKKPAPVLNIGIDIDPEVTQMFSLPGVDVINDDAARFLENYNFCGDEFVYSDPPYPVETRKSATRYNFDYTTEQHVELLEILKTLPCMVMISSYWSKLYAKSLAEWNCHSFESQTRRGKAVEWLVYNYPRPTELHDYRYLGDDFRERERIKRKRKRWIGRISKMPTLERNAMLAELPEQIKEVIRSTIAENNDPVRIPSPEMLLNAGGHRF